ncbi:MAG: 50S ribosomal protein L2 [Candidatus Gottesmanbacteria bacterium GW2011_GWA2_41_12]|uniref:Large ribosomal subunit protein uL2 n=2 Tax=Candidatus Gottesmaniibacteriota TaxID=1752720 RepID=A0A0G0ULV6_9BACT|nr:MAG: 50S ribosomal protein L2 [Candidatus Gottesmanbacteria bacterium GW2011_GWC2_39_8]KKR88516.1 MAG: 50S ribosomal protein L2 [Candidatus Gottesmanbacteria bacterium GW2011_GWA2_41_12]
MDITKREPEKNLISILPKVSGRNNQGKVTSGHRGGREKRFYRQIDWKRDKRGIAGKVVAFEYDPNRKTKIALIHYSDGEKRYILLPEGLKIGDIILSGKDIEIKTGNALMLGQIPVGIPIHNIEFAPGRGGQIARSAGNYATVIAKEGKFAQVKLSSGEIRTFPVESMATIGQLGNADWKNTILGKAGASRHRGIRPHVRGTAQNPRSHPHGGGEGRSGEGLKQPKTPWGKPARGLKTRKKGKYSDKAIIKRRK